MQKFLRLFAVLAAFTLLATACGDDDSDTDAASGDGTADSITVYSGRSEELIQPLLDAFTEETGIEVEARYGDSAELALLIQTEGDSSPADVFISQSPGALGLLTGEDRLATLPAALTDLVDDGFAASDDTWVGITGRVRVVVYNSELVDEADLPSSVLDLTDAYDGDELIYMGPSHVTGNGNERIARRLDAFVGDRLRERARARRAGESG